MFRQKLSISISVLILMSTALQHMHVTYGVNFYEFLSYDVASGSEITPCNKIDKPLVVYRSLGNVMTSIITLDIYDVHNNVV